MNKDKKIIPVWNLLEKVIINPAEYDLHEFCETKIQ